MRTLLNNPSAPPTHRCFTQGRNSSWSHLSCLCLFFFSTAHGVSLEPPLPSLLCLSPAPREAPWVLPQTSFPSSDGAKGAAKPGSMTQSDLWGPEFGEDNGASSPPALRSLSQGPTIWPRFPQSQAIPKCDPRHRALGSPQGKAIPACRPEVLAVRAVVCSASDSPYLHDRAPRPVRCLLFYH